MTEHLPESTDDWPDDAWKLLGVEHDADLKSLRRAYTRLIRKFKPEHSPDEFQKIREAYDAARAFFELKEQLELGDDSAIRLVDPLIVKPADKFFDEAKASTESQTIGLPDESPGYSASEVGKKLENAWAFALAGDIATARNRLEELHTETPDNEDVIARLYWIRKITPSEPIEELIEWLIGIVKRRGVRGRPWQFLLTESAWNSRETLRDDIVDLVCAGSQPERLVPLLLIRWKRASRVLNWKVIRNDLTVIRNQFLPDNPEVWLELLVSALQIVVWAETIPDDLQKELVDEISQFEEMHLQFPQAFDHLDELLEVRQELHRAFQFVPRSTLSLIREDILGLTPESDERLLGLARKWKDRPGITLTDLDRLAQNCPAIFLQLLYCMSRLNSSNLSFPEGQQAVITRLIEEFIEDVEWQNPINARLSIVDFCVREALPLRYLVNIFESRKIPAYMAESVAPYLQGDAVLHCLCEGVSAASCR